VPGGQHQRGGLDARAQLEERHDRAGERHRTDEHPEEDLDVVDRGQRTRQALGAEVGVEPDEHGRQADEAVQHRDQLGHLGHLDDARPPQADAGPDDHGDRDEQQGD
jgi:hypothetical protein